jgi:hypothetical protein
MQFSSWISLLDLCADSHINKSSPWRMSSGRCVDLALSDVSEERIASSFRAEKSASEETARAGGCRLSHQSETTSYIRTGWGITGNMGKSTERRGVGSVVKVIQAGSRGMSRTGKGIGRGWGKIQGYWVSIDPVASGLEMASMHWPS